MTRSDLPRFMPPDSQLDQDWRRLSAHLSANGHSLDLDHPVRQFAVGFGNLNYRIRMDGELAVLRRPPPGPLPPGANDMVREARILTGLSPQFRLAPACLYSSGDTDALGAPFLIMEYRPGLVIRGTLPREHQGRPEVGDRLSSMLINTLSALHAIEPAAAGLGELGRPEGFLARTTRGWARRAELAWDGETPAQVPEIVAWLDRQPVREPPPALLHNDYKLDNIILDPETLAPRAVIDWDLGTRGDPLWDLAVLLSYWVQPQDHPAMQALKQMPSAQPGFPSRRDMIERYAAAGGRPVDDIRRYRVLAQFRLAVVFRQIFRRFRDSGEDSARGAGFDRLADGLMDFTMAVMAGRSE